MAIDSITVIHNLAYPLGGDRCAWSLPPPRISRQHPARDLIATSSANKTSRGFVDRQRMLVADEPYQ